MRVRAIVLAGVTSHATVGCASPDGREAELRLHRPPIVAFKRKTRPETTGCSPRDSSDAGLRMEAAFLARAMLAYQPLVRNRRGGKEWIHGLALHNVNVVESMRCETRPLLSREKDPYLLAVIQFHESSWRPNVTGQRGEVGLMQVHGVALQGRRRDEARDPETNIRLGYEYLLRCRDICGPGPDDLWLGAFASGSCDGRIPAVGDFRAGLRILLEMSRG